MFKERDVWHDVQEDEDLPLIAAQYGIKDWKLVYEHSKNADLRELRPNAHVLYDGDRVWVPKVEPKVFDAATNKKHEFVLYPPRTVLQLFLRDNDGNPYGGIGYELWIAGERYGEGDQKTRDDGLIFEMIPLVKEVELRIWFPVPKQDAAEDDDSIEEGDPTEEDEKAVLDWWDDDRVALSEEQLEVDPDVYETVLLKLAHLDPAYTIEGVQDRLRNLNYSCGDEHGTIGLQTEWAITEFQYDHGLPATGKIDVRPGANDPTMKKLLEVYRDSEGEASSSTE